MISTSSWASRAAGSWVSPPNMTWFIAPSWADRAASRTGWPCPWIAVHQELMASSASTGSPPRISVNRAPCAATATTGAMNSAPIVLYGCHRCAASIALICSGVSPAFAAGIVIEGKAADSRKPGPSGSMGHHGHAAAARQRRARTRPGGLRRRGPGAPRVIRVRLAVWDVVCTVTLLVLLAVLATATTWPSRLFGFLAHVCADETCGPVPFGLDLYIHPVVWAGSGGPHRRRHRPGGVHPEGLVHVFLAGSGSGAGHGELRGGNDADPVQRTLLALIGPASPPRDGAATP